MKNNAAPQIIVSFIIAVLFCIGIFKGCATPQPVKDTDPWYIGDSAKKYWEQKHK